jgi:hypothetical protein
MFLPVLSVPLWYSPHSGVLLRAVGAQQRNLSVVLKQALIDVDAMLDGQPFVVDAQPMLKRGGAGFVSANMKNGPFVRALHRKIFYSNH